MRKLFETIRRSFSEFLAVPLAEVIGFLFLAWLVSYIDMAAGDRGHWAGWRRALDSFIGNPDEANQLMATVATSLITMSSITFSILLLAVQQSSAALTNQIVDQYMRRPANQSFFGFFVGSSLFALTCLGLVRKDAVPVLAATTCLLLAIICLVLLVTLIYSTLDQTRPSSIISTIHDATLRARRHHMRRIERVHASTPDIEGGQEIACDGYGYVGEIDFETLLKIAQKDAERRIVIEKPTGAPICEGQSVARATGGRPLDEDEIARVRKAIRVARRRELTKDPMFGVDQLGNIGWTSVSTAKSNPAAGLIAIHSLNDLLYVWGNKGELKVDGQNKGQVYCRDTLMDHLACAYESLLVVASESMQQQSLAEISKGIARALPHLPAEMQGKLERAVLGGLSAMGDHVPTDVLCQETERLESAFRKVGRSEVADKLATAWEKLARARGHLHSRADRVPA